jgi:hypothetical protein
MEELISEESFDGAVWNGGMSLLNPQQRNVFMHKM